MAIERQSQLTINPVFLIGLQVNKYFDSEAFKR